MKNLIILIAVFLISSCSKQEEKKPYVEKSQYWNCVVTLDRENWMDGPTPRRYFDTTMTRTEYNKFRAAKGAYCVVIE